jgi:hypothetical protein
MKIVLWFEDGDIENNQVTAKLYMTHKEWLDNEYRQWVEALQSCNVHNFKENPMVRRMLSLDATGDIFNFVKGYSNDDNSLVNKIVKIDLIGYGRTVPVPAIFPEFATLRMIHYAQQILKRNPSSICEIGGGVGQFYAILRALGYKGTYRIMDLPEVQDFQHKYLEEVAKQTGLNTELDPGFVAYEMLISFYALGEFGDKEKQEYSSITQSVPHGYIAWNPHSGASDDLSLFKHDIKVTPGIEEGVKIIEW